jgi:hypothetical protein
MTNAGAKLLDEVHVSATLDAVQRPVRPLVGIDAAVIAVLHPNPEFVVQINALAAVEHPETDCAVGAALEPVGFETTVLAPIVERSEIPN